MRVQKLGFGRRSKKSLISPTDKRVMGRNVEDLLGLDILKVLLAYLLCLLPTHIL